jgi:NADPH-dependent 2,4-dienoyl-CoA reductase/sulfur reductase-like enzyme
VEPQQAHLMTTGFFEPKLHNAGRVANVRDACEGMVVLAAPGRVTSMAEAEMLIARGVTDMVGAVRGQIAEPNLVRHALEGREAESRTCIAAKHCQDGDGFGCALNAVVGREERWGRNAPPTALTSMKVVVVGGGPAGLEAARVAAGRGHSVVLFERRDGIGGGLTLWSRLPGCDHLTSTTTWFERRLSAVGVEVRTGVEANVARILEERPDVVVLASGSRYAPTGTGAFDTNPLPGWDRKFVHTPEDILEGGVRLKGRVVVLDEEGLHTGAGIAELAALGGAEVELVTRKVFPAASLMATMQQRYIASRLMAAEVKISGTSYIREIGDGWVRLIDLPLNQERIVEDVDAVVLATQRLPVTELQDALVGKVKYVYRVGDALAPRSLREATYEGHRFGRVIGEPDMPADVVEELFRPIEPLRAAEFA